MTTETIRAAERDLTVQRVSTTKATEVLGWQPRSVADTLVATAESLRSN